MKRTFPQLFGMSQIQPVEDYPSHLLNMLLTSQQIEQLPLRGWGRAGGGGSAVLTQAF